MQDDPIEILKRRLASGEISAHEFNELSAVLINRHNQIRDVNHRKHSSSFKDKPIIMIDAQNWFENKTFCHKGSVYNLSEIQALKSNLYTKTINLAPSHYSGFEVTLMNGKVLKYKAASVIIRTKRVNLLSDAFTFISKQTFNQRLSYYLNEINYKGYFQYRDYFIYENGDIKHKNKTVNIAEAALQNSVEFGRKSSFGLKSYYTPDEIWVYQKIPSKFLKQHVVVKTKENRDVIYAILVKLAKLKGGTVEFVKR